jgi:hypothetical protein
MTFCAVSLFAPQTGLEPVTLRLTAGCSTIELLRNIYILKMENKIKYNEFICQEMAAPNDAFLGL